MPGATLETILRDVGATLASRYYRVPARRVRPPLSLRTRLAAMKRKGLNSVIAEIKPAAPSYRKKPPNTPDELLDLYLRHPVAGISILTEPVHFGGSLDLLTAAHRQSAIQNPKSKIQNAVPVLMKDFVISRVQIEAAFNAGADAVLLILALFNEGRAEMEIGRAVALCRERGMEPIIEVANGKEYLQARDMGAEMVGINNRDLKTMRVDTAKTARILKRHGKRGTVVAMSGCRTADDVKVALRAGADAALVGTALAFAPDPGELLAGMLAGGKR